MLLRFDIGFKYEGRIFVWHEGDLYSYPFEYQEGKKRKGLRKVKYSPEKKLYRVCGKWMVADRVLEMTKKIKVAPVEVIENHKDLPKL